MKIIIGFLLAFAQIAVASPLVSKETIQRQKDFTSLHHTSNGIPVILRNEPSSKIALISIQFDYGLKDSKPGKKSVPGLMSSLMARATKSYSKDEMSRLTEKYALPLGCSSGIDQSSCSMETVETYWDATLPLLASVVKEPLFDPSDIKLYADRSIAGAKKIQSDPEDFVNEIANRVYYPLGHPYINPVADQISELPNIGPLELSNSHLEMLDAQRMSIVVVSNMDPKKILKDLNEHFGSLKANPNFKRYKVEYPDNHSLKKLSYEFRDIPTSYIRIKFPTPNATHPDAVAMKLLFDVLAEEMHTEIRTKRGLSYAAHAMTSQISIGHGVLAVSTPKPKEVIPVILSILKKSQTQLLPQSQLNEYKKGFATSYLASGETHSSLAGSLLGSWYYFGNTTNGYDFPTVLDKVSNKEIKKLASAYFKDMKIGFIGPASQFDESWFQALP